MAPDCSEFQSQSVQIFGYVFRDINVPNHGQTLEDPVVLLERSLYRHPFAGLLWERQFEEVLLEFGWEEVPNWECPFVHRKQGLHSSVYNLTQRRLRGPATWKDMLKLRTGEQKDRAYLQSLKSWLG